MSFHPDVEKSAYDSTPPPLIIRELDENGFLASVYEGAAASDVTIRTIKQRSGRFGESGVNLLQSLINVFLPTGYPNSVSPDYIDYQIFDSVQAFSSSIASLFANRAVLSAVGVGDETATSTSALFMKIIQETVGRLGTIIFAWKLGSGMLHGKVVLFYFGCLYSQDSIRSVCHVHCAGRKLGNSSYFEFASLGYVPGV
jgi:hypothetical protein